MLTVSATALPVDEASYFILKSRAVAVLTASSVVTLGQSLERYINTSTAHRLCCIPIAPSLCLSTLLPSDILISSDKYLDDNAAGVVIFTSGTTGPPKGAVMRRGFVHDAATAVADHYQLNDHDVILHVLPVHHATGIGITFFPFLVSGSCIEFKSGSFDSKWMWERWRRGGLTFFSGVPTIYMRMMRYYEDHLSKLPPGQLEEYIAGAKQFRGILCGTSALPRPFQKFWTSIRGGDMILTRYGATEFGAVFKVPLQPGDTPDGSVGEIVPGVDVKLSEGDEGEVLVKSPYMFSKYVFTLHAPRFDPPPPLPPLSSISTHQLKHPPQQTDTSSTRPRPPTRTTPTATSRLATSPPAKDPTTSSSAAPRSTSSSPAGTRSRRSTSSASC